MPLWTPANLGTLTFKRNQAFEFDFTFTDENDQPVQLTLAGDDLYGCEMQIRFAPGDGEPRLYTFSTDPLVAENGEKNVFLDYEGIVSRIYCIAPDVDTVDWEAGSYNLDFRFWLLDNPEETSKYLFEAKLKIEGVVTAPDPDPGP